MSDAPEDKPKKKPAAKKPVAKKAPKKKPAAKKKPVKKATVAKPEPKKKPWTSSDFHGVMDNIMCLSKSLAKLETARSLGTGAPGGVPAFGGDPMKGICARLRDSLELQLYALDELTKEFLPYKTEREKITDIIESNSVKDITAAVDAGLALVIAPPVPSGVPIQRRPSPLPVPGINTTTI